MNPYSIPSFISALFLLTLSFISISYGKKERVNIVFALFVLLLSLASYASFRFYESAMIQEALQWVKLPFLLNVPALLFALYYTLVITDKISNLSKKYLGISFRIYLTFLLVSGLFLVTLTISTDWLIAGVEYRQPDGFEHKHASFFALGICWIAITVATILTILYRAFRTATSPPQKVLFLYNLVGFSTMYVLSAIARLVLSHTEFPSYAFSFVPFSLAAVIFALALLRYHFSEIIDLNHGLEKRVEERTRELRETQTHLVRSEKMAALGKLVAGIAHEINNPLGAATGNNNTIKNAALKIQSQLNGNDKTQKTLNVINQLSKLNETSLNRIADIVKSLKRFARLDEAEVIKTNLNECIETALVLLGHEIKDRIKIATNFDILPDIYCKAGYMNQVLMSLIHNAIEAIEGEGEITIHTGKTDSHVWMKICDNGCGIPADKIEKVFDPGFTTKGRGVGTGMGLAIAYQIIRDHGGQVFVNSEYGKGSTFTINIPISSSL